MLLTAIAAAALTAGADRAQDAERLLKAAMNMELVDGNVKAAIEQYKRVVEVYGQSERATGAKALLRMAEAYQKLGDAQVGQIYERLLREFNDQKEIAAEAQSRLAALRSTAVSATKPIARQIANGTDVMDPRPSSDGRYLSFTDPATGDLAIRDLVTGTNRRVTNTGDWFSEYSDAAVISPDDRHVAFTWYIHKENKVELRTASIAPGEPIRLNVVRRAEIGDSAYNITWMPDGKQLLIVRNLPDRTSQIGTVNIEDGSFRNIKSLEWRKPNLLSLSPDGRYVAYDVPAVEAGSPLDVMVLATDGNRETAVVKNPANDSSPLWSADGSRLVFLSDRTGSNALWTVPIDEGRPNGQPTLLKPDVGPIRLLGLTKTGTLYYFEPSAGRPNLYLSDLDTVHATNPPVPLTERIINYNIGPTWSRDGQYLAYYSFREPPSSNKFTGVSGALVIRSAKTGEERTVPLPARASSRFGAGPKWFPDNRSVLVESRDAEGSGFGFYRLVLDTGNTERLAHLSEEVSSYDLSPDGRTIVYAIGFGSTGQKLMRCDIDSHRETELRNFPIGSSVQIVALAVSPDGLQLAMTITGGAVEVMPAAGGPARLVFSPAARELGTGSLLQALTWTPDQRFVLFTRGDRSFWKVPALGGEAEKVIPMAIGVKSPAVHPDGKRIVFSSASAPNTSKVWALENFLPRSSTRP